MEELNLKTELLNAMRRLDVDAVRAVLKKNDDLKARLRELEKNQINEQMLVSLIDIARQETNQQGE